MQALHTGFCTRAFALTCFVPIGLSHVPIGFLALSGYFGVATFCLSAIEINQDNDLSGIGGSPILPSNFIAEFG